MKKFFVIILSAALLLGSFSFAYAAAQDVSDSETHSRLTTTNNYLSSISSFLSGNLYTRLGDILNSLNVYSSGRTYSVAQRVDSILTWMSPILSAINNNGFGLNDKFFLWSSLGEYSTDGSSSSLDPYLKNIYQVLSNPTLTVPNFSWNISNARKYASRNFIGTGMQTDGSAQYYLLGPNGTYNNRAFFWGEGSPLGNIGATMQYIITNQADAYAYQNAGYANTQTAINWESLGNSNFTGISTADTTFKWLSAIQAPVARLAYVLANDDQINARENAADNEAAVVDNFIDSSGSGSASVSDIGSIASASDGFKNYISTNASALGIWNIFNSSNGNWFSQEIASSLDTSSGANRSIKYSAPLMTSGSAIKARNYNYDYETPALDKQVNEIMSLILGGDKK